MRHCLIAHLGMAEEKSQFCNVYLWSLLLFAVYKRLEFSEVEVCYYCPPDN